MGLSRLVQRIAPADPYLELTIFDPVKKLPGTGEQFIPSRNVI